MLVDDLLARWSLFIPFVMTEFNEKWFENSSLFEQDLNLAIKKIQLQLFRVVFDNIRNEMEQQLERRAAYSPQPIIMLRCSINTRNRLQQLERKPKPTFSLSFSMRYWSVVGNWTAALAATLIILIRHYHIVIYPSLSVCLSRSRSRPLTLAIQSIVNQPSGTQPTLVVGAVSVEYLLAWIWLEW